MITTHDRRLVQRRAFLTAAIGSVAALAGCFGDSSRSLPEAPTGAWEQSAADPRNTGSSDAVVPPRGTPAWDAGEALHAEPLFADGLVFSVADGVTALDAETGEEEWAADLPESVDHTPVLAHDRLIVAAGDRLVAFESTDGSERWSTRLPRPVGDALTAGDSMVTVPLAGRIERPGIVAYATGDGEQLWTAPTVGARTAAIDGDAAYVNGYRQDGDTGILRSLAADDGSIDWEVELDHPDTGPVVADGSVVLGDDGGLGVHDPDTGERVRTLGPFGDRLPEPPAVAGGTAFLGSTDPAIVAVSIDDGSIEWTREGSVAARISAGRETVVVAAETLPEASAAGVAALERSTGDVRWEHELEGFDVFPSTPPALADGAVFFCSNDSSGVVALGDLAPAEDG